MREEVKAQAAAWLSLFDSSLPITVAALMTPKWLLRHIQVPESASRVVLPGYLAEGVEEIRSALDCRIEIGPKDIRDLGLHFGKSRQWKPIMAATRSEIIAEINYAARLSIAQLQVAAQQLVADGANWVDLGCEPGSRWTNVAQAVRSLRDLGIRCSIDSFDPWRSASSSRRCRTGAFG